MVLIILMVLILMWIDMLCILTLLFKDLVTIFAFFLVLSYSFFYPNLLGHSDNYIPADPMVTPASIVPEWYIKRCHA
jgi:quinol-cytochrome oxidoreductase complex cytochrome b subunit